MFSVVHVLDPTVEDSDALLTVIEYVDIIYKFKLFSVRIDGVDICPTETTGLIPTNNTPCVITPLGKISN